MEKWKSIFRILKKSWRPLFEFELLYKLLAVTVFTPLFSLTFQGIMEVTGYAYLTADNVIEFLTNPLTILLNCVFLLLLAYYVLFDISAILYAVDQGRNNQETDVLRMFTAAGKISLRVFKPRNWPLALIALLLLPFLNIGVISGYVSTIAIPEAVLESLSQRQGLLVALFVVGVLLVWMLLRWAYVFHYFVLEGCPLTKAAKRSVRLGKGHRLWDFMALFSLELGFALLFALFTMLLIACIVLVGKLLESFTLLGAVATSVVWVAIGILFLIFTVLSVPLGFCCISVLYYHHKGEKQEALVLQNLPQVGRAHKRPRYFRWVEAGVALALVLCCSVYVYQIAKGEANFNIEYVRMTEVTAHRGASVAYPENTMAAFEGAVELGADWIELDVQQTLDRQIVVMHDTNLRRTTGVNRNVWEMNYADIAKLDAGSWFSPEFAGETIPLLSKVLEYAQENDMRLNIELKPSGHEFGFEESVVALVREYDFADRCVITSQNYKVLERVKAYDPEIKTVYVMSVAYGNLLKLKAADAFSIKSINITSDMVSRLHDGEKEVYAWTVNTGGSIDKMIRLNVDNVITDNITLAKERVFANKTSNLIQEYIDFLENF